VSAVGRLWSDHFRLAATVSCVRKYPLFFGRLRTARPSAAEEAGPQTLAWSSTAAGRLAHVVAAFGPIRYPLSVQVIGEGTVEPGSGSHSEGSVVELLARPSPGHRFIGWSGDLSGESNPATLTIDGAKRVTATFERDFALYGWATANGGTTGGESGPEVVSIRWPR